MMKNNVHPILTASDIKDWDRFTIEADAISSLQLMEQAAQAFTDRVIEYYTKQQSFYIFCGTGNNGGDGFAIARLLAGNGFDVQIYLIGNTASFSSDAKANYERLAGIRSINNPSEFPSIPSDAIIVDALLGIGTNRPLNGLLAELVLYLNQCDADILSVDIPSGWYADSIHSALAIKADQTFTFGTLKQSFLFPESEEFTGEVIVLDIGLSKNFIPSSATQFFWLDTDLIQQIVKPVEAFAHKGTNGHAALITGSEGMMGAAILTARASMRAGAGKTTSFIPTSQFQVIYQAAAEVLVKEVNSFSAENQFQAIGIGSGSGNNAFTIALLNRSLQSGKPLVIDADGINSIPFIEHIQYPTPTILTPHVKEAALLTGEFTDSYELLENCCNYSKIKNVYIVLKGKNSRVICPSGEVYFNTTGNPGMASAGMGDVLTGIITSLLAQGYNGREAALLGVYWHGLAADIAAETISYPGLIASDVIEHLGTAYLRMQNSF